MNRRTANVPCHTIVGDYFVDLDDGIIPPEVRVEPVFTLLLGLSVLGGNALSLPLHSDL